MLFGGLSIVEWSIVLTLFLAAIGGFYKMNTRQVVIDEDVKDIKEVLKHLEASGERRGAEQRVSVHEIKKEIEARIIPLEQQMSVHSSYIASQGATLTGIHTKLQDITSQLSMIINHMWREKVPKE